jgi:hypothetical protein
MLAFVRVCAFVRACMCAWRGWSGEWRTWLWAARGDRLDAPPKVYSRFPTCASKGRVRACVEEGGGGEGRNNSDEGRDAE